MGLTGPSGVLPRHYYRVSYKIECDARAPEKHALRDWLDLFNHRLVSLFYRAWEKYRFYDPFERGEYDGPRAGSVHELPLQPDRAGIPAFARAAARHRPRHRRRTTASPKDRVLARIEDLVLLHFSGMLGHRPRCAVALEAMVQDYFQVPARIDQFQGQWLQLEPPNRTHLDGELGNNQLGVSAVAGDQRLGPAEQVSVRLGPMTYAQFTELLPDRDPVRRTEDLFLARSPRPTLRRADPRFRRATRLKAGKFPTAS